MTSVGVDTASKESLGQALGKLSSGVYIATLEHNGQMHGMLATWVIQAAFDPPMLTIALQTQRELLHHLVKGSHFAVNALSKKNMDIFKAFAKPHQDGEDRFAGLTLANTHAAYPAFADALSFLACEVKDHVVAGDHTIVVAEITGGQVLNAADEPMLHTRKNGFQY